MKQTQEKHLEKDIAKVIYRLKHHKKQINRCIRNSTNIYITEILPGVTAGRKEGNLNLEVVEYKNIRVLTTQQIAEAYGTDVQVIHVLLYHLISEHN